MQWSQLLNDQRKPKSKQYQKDSNRSSFEQDFDRIIFSNPFRSLQDKTQVLPLPRHDFVHTRLTHSLEVSSVARSLGKIVGAGIIAKHPELKEAGFTVEDFGAITAAAALAHDLGNPPFGHAGESAISDYFYSDPIAQNLRNEVSEKEWKDLISFEGNAQGFRILNKSNYQGLQLTFATLGAFTKYPCESVFTGKDPNRKSQKKYGFYQCSRDIFAHMAEATGLISLGDTTNYCWVRHPLSFLVEAADDICYGIIDLEDGTNLGLVPFEETKTLLAGIIGEKYNEAKLNVIQLQREKTGQLRALAIGTLIQQCAEKFLSKEDEILKGTFDASLTNSIPAAPWLNKIIDLSVVHIYQSKPVLQREIAGFTVLNGLLEAFMPAVIRLSNRQKKVSWRDRTLMKLMPLDTQAVLANKVVEPYPATRECLDFIASLTDTHALELYRNIKGISLPGV